MASEKAVQAAAIGDVVHYVLPESGVYRTGGAHRPAVVVHVHEEDPHDRLNLNVHLDGTNDRERAVLPWHQDNTVEYVAKVPRDEVTFSPGTWHRPEQRTHA